MLTVYDELIAALRFCDGGECDGCCEYKREHGCNTLLRDAADAIEEQSLVLESYRNRMKAGCDWIPVTERLPKENIPVLAWESQGFSYVDRLNDGKWEIADNNCGTVTHWMPLPDPPGEEPDA